MADGQGEQIPETQYARSADGTNLAYQITGDGALELVYLHGATMLIDLLSDDPGFVRLRRWLGTFSSTLWFMVFSTRQ
jgi:hypothetical protein